MQWNWYNAMTVIQTLHKRKKERKLQCKKAPIDKWMLIWAYYRTVRVQNYAGSVINRGNCWMCSSSPWHTTRLDGPSWRPVKTAVKTGVAFLQPTWRPVTWPVLTARQSEKHCRAMLFWKKFSILTAPLTHGPSCRPSWRQSRRPSRRAVRTARLDGSCVRAFRLTRDVHALYISISNDTKHRAGLSAIATLLVP